MSLHFFEIDDSEQRYLMKHLPDETREIAADAEIVSPFLGSSSMECRA